jgi:hypothetical protein
MTWWPLRTMGRGFVGDATARTHLPGFLNLSFFVTRPDDGSGGLPQGNGSCSGVFLGCATPGPRLHGGPAKA